MALEPYQQRVVEEQKDLNDKITKLTAFMQGQTFQQLPKHDRDLLTLQALAMAQYAIILQLRIARFE